MNIAGAYLAARAQFLEIWGTLSVDQQRKVRQAGAAIEGAVVGVITFFLVDYPAHGFHSDVKAAVLAAALSGAGVGWRNSQVDLPRLPWTAPDRARVADAVITPAVADAKAADAEKTG